MNRILRLFVCWAVLHTAALTFAAETSVALSINSPWRYTTNNLDGTNWTATSYNDSWWFGPSNALFYIETGSIPGPKNTPLPPKPGGSLPYNTYYFRTTFQVTNAAYVIQLTFSNLVDDGVVYYLNGLEIQRLHIAAGTVTYSTTASDHEATSYEVFTITGNLLTNLVEGNNTLAAEVHQVNSTSSDIVFGTALFGITETNVGGLFFDGAGDYVTFGVSSSLNVSNFTLECWFKRAGTGATASTGTGGTVGVPLVTRGRGEEDGSNKDCNFFFGIDGTGNRLVADFESFESTANNYPATGITAVASSVWQHGAVTFDGTNGNWNFYLNGVPDGTKNYPPGANKLPRYDSIQHAGLATAMTSSGATAGFFNGTLDEVRIWNYERSASQIANNYYVQITNATGLVARWSLNETSGATASNSVSGGVNGTLLNGPLWSGGYPFTGAPPGTNNPPNAPTLNAPGNDSADVTNSPTLSVAVSDPDTNNLTVTFYGRVASTSSVPDFTLIGMPDTQFYSQTYSNISVVQADWIATNRLANNIVYVAQLGDCVQSGDNGGNDLEWRNATNAMYRLEVPLTTLLPQGIPYGIAVGNHDQGSTGNGNPNDTTTFYNQYFGEAHFLPYDYYGGHYGTNNDNHYDLFSAGGMDFIAIYFEYNSAMATNSPVLAWANTLLQTHSNRRAILVSHWIVNTGFGATFSTQGQAMYDALKGNTNLFLMLCGHVCEEGQRNDTFNGRTVYSVLSDYQCRTNGGNGWLRIYEFSPTNNVIRVKTYSPWVNQFETDANSQFEIPYAMTTTNPFTVIGSSAGVPSGGNAAVTWFGLQTNTTYEWFATVSDGQASVTGPTWRFTTGTNVGPVPPTVTLTNPANGTAFTAPANITLAANAADSDGTVTNVAFYQGATKLADDPASPFSFAWNGVVVGSYALKAVASDSTGFNTTSAIVNVTVNAPTTVSRGPYLQNGSHTNVSIRWRTAAATDSRVLYGTNVADLAQSVLDGTSTNEHEIKLVNLLPDTKYFYSVGTSGTPLAGGDTNHFFLTAPLPGTDKPTRIWVLGDAGVAGKGIPAETADQTAVRNAYYNFTGARHTDLWLMLGDNAYDTGTDSQFQAAVFDMYPTMLRKSVLWPTRGNHESATANGSVYYNIFTMPRSGEAGGLASGNEAYYSFDYGNIHFVCLDSEGTSRATNGAMAVWLASDLATTTADWIIAYWHHPPYTKGSHNSDDAGDSGGRMTDMRQNILPILEANGVDVVMTGHSHCYERSYFLDGHYGLSGTLTNTMKLDAGNGRTNGTGAYQKLAGGSQTAHKGAVYVVAGSSGQRDGGSLNHPAMFISLDVLGSLVLDINGNRLDATFVRETAGATNDYFTILKTNSPPVASFATYLRNRGASLKISQTNLLTTYTSDPDGDPRSLTSVGPSPNASIVTNATYIFYSATNPDSVSSDTFGYVVTDGVGGSTSNNILITVTNIYGSNNLVSLQIGVPVPNSNTITFAGVPGYEYIVQYATNLPGNPWNNLATNIAGTNGLWMIIATNDTRYYRTKY